MFDGDNSAAASTDNADSGGTQEGGSGVETFKPITSEADLAQYKADLRKNIAADLRKSIKAELDAERTAAEDEARRKKAIDDATAKGEFETVKQKLEDDIKAAKADATTLKADNDRYKTVVDKLLEDEWKTLDDQAREAFVAAGGNEEDPFARLAYLTIGKKHTASRAGTNGEPLRGSGRDPIPAGSTKRTVEDEARLLNRTGNYAM